VGDNLWFCVLGPVRGWRDGVEVDLGSPQQRAALAALLLSEGGRVSVEQLSDALWGEIAPARALHVIRTYVSRLRQTLEPDQPVSTSLIRTVTGGYVLTPPTDGFDLAVFRRKVSAAHQARDNDDLPTAATLLRDALALWHGDALAGVTGAYADTQRTQLRNLQLNAVATHLSTQLDLDGHATVIPELMTLVDHQPLDERFREMLMLAHYRSGQQAAALTQYRDAQTVLADELGIDPGPALQALHERILRADPELLTVHPPRAETPAPVRVLSQLPPRLAVFAGRDHELTQANTLITDHDTHPGAVVISGTAGVGKTAFAVHWAHQLTHHFPDGQLYLNLRGFDPTTTPITPTDATRTLLELLGTPPQSIPEGPEAMAALYRGLLADRRILLVLDNARLATQVRPLLPGNTGCLAIITSRNQLTGLLAIDGAHSITLNTLTTTTAHALLTRRIGHHRTSAEPHAVHDIIQLCAGLPLALAIVAAHCTTRPALSLAAIATAVRDRATHLDTFSAHDNDTAANIRDVFSWSYHALTPHAARMFRLIALHPGPDATVAAVASLTALPLRTTEELLGELTRATLLTEHAPGGHYSYHDLLRTYASELTETTDTPTERAAARHRMLDHYVHTAHTAAMLFNPFRDETLELRTPQPGAVLDVSLDQDTVLSWFTDMHPVLLAAAEYAVAHGFDLHAWQLAWTLDTYLYRSGHWQDALVVHTSALQAAQRLADPVLQAKSHSFLGGAHRRLGRDRHAERHLTEALGTYRAEGLSAGQAGAHLNLGIVVSSQGRSQECIEHSRRALAIYRQLGDDLGHAAALSNLGWEHGLIGEYDTALALTHEALLRWTELGDRHAQAHCHDNLAYSYHHVGDHQRAAENYRSAIDTFRELGDHTNEAISLDRLGDAHTTAGDNNSARLAWAHALTILDSNDSVDTTDLRLKLERTADPTPHRSPAVSP
jgi:DNA-binding SARP family transcriptional activator/tetratricopeptide (TPR) repeat protein